MSTAAAARHPDDDPQHPGFPPILVRSLAEVRNPALDGRPTPSGPASVHPAGPRRTTRTSRATGTATTAARATRRATTERSSRTGSSTPESPTRRLRLVDDFGPVHTELAALPDPARWLQGVAVAVFEAAHGARPATQVMRFLSPEVYDSIVRRSGRAARRGSATRRPVRLRRVHAAALPGHASVVEGCAVIDDHQRVRVMAVRLEGLDGRWLLTACEIG